MKTALRLNEAPLFYFKIKGMVELRTANNGNFLRRVDFGFNRTVGTLHHKAAPRHTFILWRQPHPGRA